MNEKNSIVKLATDMLHGKVETYDSKSSEDVLREALIAANGGSSKLNVKALRRNKVEIFEIIEELVPLMVNEGLKGDEFFMNYVEERNIAEGDKNEFVAPDNSTFIVSEIANGIATPRRQRIGEKTVVSVKTTVHAIRMYEEFSRFMAGRIDWNELVAKVAEAFKAAIYNDIYTAFKGISATTVGLSNAYVGTGTADAEKILAIVEHTEAANGESAVIVGTKAALRKCPGAELGNNAKTDLYNAGYFGKFYGTPMVAVKNRHKVGTDEFIFDDNTIYVFAGGDKFVKFVREAESYIVETQTGNADMSMEYLYTDKYGVAILVNGKLGKYTITG